MNEDEAALLAELRAISNKSASSRFDDPNPEGQTALDQPLPNPQKHTDEFSPSTSNPVIKEDTKSKSVQEKMKSNRTSVEQDENATASRSNSRRTSGELPPWKRKRQAQSSNGGINKDPMNIEVVVVSPTKTETKPEPPSHSAMQETSQSKSINVSEGVDNFNQASTFQGERGGDAVDAELLALLKGVSAKSGATDRFAEEQGGNEPLAIASSTNETLPTVESRSSPKPTSKPIRRKTRDPNEIPPWKRRGRNEKTSTTSQSVDQNEVDIVVAAAPTSSRAGLASGSGNVTSMAASSPPVGIAEGSAILAGKVNADDMDESKLLGGGGNFKQESAFEGERGGEAHDDELLALLRGVSANSNAGDRFGDGNNSDPKSNAQDKDISLPKTEIIPQRSPNDVPPWKRGKVASKQTAMVANNTPEMVAIAKPALDSHSEELANEANPFQTTCASQNEEGESGGAGVFNQESTFQGERGGDARDEDLLAMLRNISTKSGGTDRFSDSVGGIPTDASEKPSKAELGRPPLVASTVHETNQSIGRPSTAATVLHTKVSQSMTGSNVGVPTPFPEEGAEEQIIVTKQDLPDAFSDSNWKVRKEAFRILNELILEASELSSPRAKLDANDILSGLEDDIPNFLYEKNAFALESAMQAVTSYAENCFGAASPDRAQTIMKALFKGSGLTSPRPSSSKMASSLMIKLIEVGSSTESATVVVNALVNQGLTSKKPKVVQLSTSLILEATYSFGAASLPLATIVASLPKVLSHSNKKVRECGIEIVAEFCRALGSKAPMEEVIGKMQKSQVKDLDVLLEKQPSPTPIKIGLRCQRVGFSDGDHSCSASDALAALQSGGEELARQRYATRPAINLIDAIKKTDFESKLKLTKWSEKVGGLDMALACGGERPYKLAEPSSSCNYVPLISQMKGLLTHTHFAVVTKSMAVLAMLAEGVGEKLYPNLRPLLPKLLQLSKDKKLTKGVSACLDDFFGNVLGYEHLLDDEASLKDGANESKEKNALARTTALDYLERCIKKGLSAGPRALMTPSIAANCANFASEKLNDSDASVRKSALNVLKSLQNVDADNVGSVVANVIAGLQQSNPRAFKTLSDPSRTKTPPAVSHTPTLRNAMSIPPESEGLAKKSDLCNPSNSGFRREKDDTSNTNLQSVRPQASLVASEGCVVPQLDTAIAHCASLGIPLWEGADEEEGGVLAGIKSPKWQSRNSSIKSLTKFVNSRPLLESRTDIERDTECLLVLVKEHTRGFKESNMNVAKSIMEFFISLCERHEKTECPFPAWASLDGTSVSVDKIADRKLASLSKTLLQSICVVQLPHIVLSTAFSLIEKARSPVAHEEFLLWMKLFCQEFGAHAVGQYLNGVVVFLKAECESKNIKVKKAAFEVLGLFHAQLGPTLKSIAFSVFKDPCLRDEAEMFMNTHPHDPSTKAKTWPKFCVLETALKTPLGAESGSADFPPFDLMSELPSDCISRMGSKDGKTAWKARKAAMEDIEKTMKNCAGVIDTSRTRPLIDLLRTLKERLSDSQSNLKPLAARLIGQILGSVEGEFQGKLGKVVFAALINAAMNDNRKNMNDAAMEALQKGTSLPSVQGEGLNEASLEPFVVALTSELDESEFKASGIAVILQLAQSFTKSLSNLDHTSAQRGDTLGGRFASVLVDALSSPKTDIRASSEALLSDCLTDGVFSKSTVRKCIARLVPAKQRSVGTILSKILSASGDDMKLEHHGAELSSTTATRLTIDRKEKLELNRSSYRFGADKQSPSSIPSIKSKEADVNDSSKIMHPLVYDAGPNGIQKSKAAMRSLTWPEYPEEPSGSSLSSGLKKAWSPLVPPETIKQLFPDGGIRKHDDAMAGFELIRQAVRMEQSGVESAIFEQRSFILRWSLLVLARKESTVGLTGLLEMLTDVISHLSSLKYELSDSETMLFVPFLFEKASISKGRFKDSYEDLINLLRAGQMVPNKKLGPLVCVGIMENSSHAKARLLACQVCYECVESIGLSGIGKKGVLVAAKSLSDEKLPENKSALLELMVLLLSRMNNDIQRFSKICGSSLSTKARASVEERMSKIENDGRIQSPEKNAAPLSHYNDMSLRLSRLPRSNQSTPVTKMVPPNTGSDDAVTFQDELPALDLRLGPSHVSKINSRSLSSGLPQPSPPSSLPRLRLTESNVSTRNSSKSPILGSTVSLPRQPSDPVATTLFPNSSGSISENSAAAPSSQSGSVDFSESLGAAASLRARLLKIREKNSGTASSNGIEVTLGKSASTAEDSIEPQSSTMSDLYDRELQLATVELKPLLDEYLAAIKNLIEKSVPLGEDDSEIVSCTDVLKNMHAAVSKQPMLAVRVDEQNITKLREDMLCKISQVVSTLTCLIEFGFNCHNPSFHAGMSVPLLSVNLASLMAIFRSVDLVTQINVDDLTLLIKEAGKALLDHRLSASSKSSGPSELDDTTSTQMVRAINKLAVQAATGATRACSLLALMRLQEQLSTNADGFEDPLFNSRMSRIVAKLMSRVIKAEESTPSPFSPLTMDLETVICALDDALVACDKWELEGNTEGAAATRSLAKLLLGAIVKGEGTTMVVVQIMERVGIDPSTSSVGSMITACTSNLGIASGTAAISSASWKTDVISLVSAVGSAKEGPDRDQAVSALKEYKERNGEADLNDHLENVSPVFREFILEVMSENPKPTSPKSSNNSMSERIKSLRSKLNQTEVVINSSVLPPRSLQLVDGDRSSTPASDDVSNPHPVATASSQASIKAFRDRLAAASDKRATEDTAIADSRSPLVPEETAGSRAAALRARLQAVKMQTNLVDGES